MTDTCPFVRGGVAVVTGAASGIGRALAIRCGEAGMKVALVDVRPMDETMADVVAAGGVCASYVCDVSDASAMADLASLVLGSYGPPTFLANNAGVSREGGTAVGGDASAYRRTFGVNFLGAVNGVTAFLPAMISSGNECVVVNTGSKQGITKPMTVTIHASRKVV